MMIQVMALMWKEWRENLKYLVLGLVVFLGPSLLYVGLMMLASSDWQYRAMIQSITYTLVTGLVFGGVYSILVGVGGVSRDFAGLVDAFWRSQPLPVWKWTTSKAICGLGNLLIVTIILIAYIYLAYAIALESQSETAQYSLREMLLLKPAAVHLLYLLLLYSLAFLLAAIIRNATKAFILSLAGGLIVYFFPLVIPPLSRMSIFELMPDVHDNIALLAVFSILGSAILLFASGVAVQRNWRLYVDQKGMAWVTGGVALLLFSGAAFQVGSNLECERIIPLNEDALDSVYIAAEGNRGVIGSYIKDNFADQTNRHLRLRTFDFSGVVPHIGQEIAVELGKSEAMDRPRVIWSLDQPEWVYLVRDELVNPLSVTPKGRSALELCTILLDPEKGGIVSRLDLMPFLPDFIPSLLDTPACLFEGQIYIHAHNDCVIVDITTPSNPTISKEIPWIRGYLRADSTPHKQYYEFLRSLPENPNLTPLQEISLDVECGTGRYDAWDGQLLVLHDSYGTRGLRLIQLWEITEKKVIFRKIGEKPLTMLERLVYSAEVDELQMREGLVYVLYGGYSGGLSILDIRDPSHIRRVGHYAAPNERFGAMHVLPDGRILLAGQNLHVVKPPRMK